MNDIRKRLLEQIAQVCMRHIEPLFKPGVQVTVIVRTPNNDEADVVVTTDNLGDVKALLARSEGRAAI
jgi:hypothetical protein